MSAKIISERKRRRFVVAADVTIVRYAHSGRVDIQLKRTEEPPVRMYVAIAHGSIGSSWWWTEDASRAHLFKSAHAADGCRVRARYVQYSDDDPRTTFASTSNVVVIEVEETRTLLPVEKVVAP